MNTGCHDRIVGWMLTFQVKEYGRWQRTARMLCPTRANARYHAKNGRENPEVRNVSTPTPLVVRK